MKKEPAVDEHGQLPTPEGEFATSAAPEPQATTGDPSGIGVTSATISGTVDPDGEPATYSFEVGVYTGAGTQYGTVLLASAGASSTPVAEAVTLNGLQPGTTYAYRITLSSGYVKNETHTTQGATKTFTTNGEPNVLVLPTVLPQLLTTPSIVFPAEHGETQPRRTLNQELDKALKACAKKPKRKRAACRRNVHRRYAAHTISKSKHRNKK